MLSGLECKHIALELLWVVGYDIGLQMDVIRFLKDLTFAFLTQKR